MNGRDALSLLRALTAPLEGDRNTPQGFARRVAEAGGLDEEADAVLAALTREIDVRKRVCARYWPDFALPEGEALAPASVTGAVAALFLFAALAVEDRRGDALKRLNTGLKACDLAAGAVVEVRAGLLALLNRLVPEQAA